MKKRYISAAVSVILCLTIITGSILSVSAAIDITDIITGMLGGGGSSGNINISESFGDWLEEKINEKGPFDNLADSFKDMWNGTTNKPSDDPGTDDKEEVIVIDKAEASNIATLFNITVNELKKSTPGFVKTQTATMDAKLSSQLQGGLGPVTGIVESLVGTKDLFASVIDGTNKSQQVRTVYNPGNDIKNNLPVSGKDYVACLTADDIKDYTISIYKSGAYRMHIDLHDVEGSAADSGLSHVFDTKDQAYATLNFGTAAMNTYVMLKYTGNYVECAVNRNGELTSFTTNMGVTFLFPQEDGSYSSTMPFLNVDFEEEGIIYKVTTEYSNFDFSHRQMGDANRDGKVNSSDARLVLRIASMLETCSEEDLPYCDVDSNGYIFAADARQILRASASIIELPTTEEALGIKGYQKSEATRKHIGDLLVILMAYQSVKDEEAQKELQDFYEDKYQNGNNTETETTTRPINSTDQMIDDVLGGVGDFIGNGGLEQLFPGGLAGLIPKK
ncbi:MAG: dockerin type I repeat-containing protein [Clostridia bacterium]|nr:dockerin type I repeat-containing protein [Clostridia bacterium]